MRWKIGTKPGAAMWLNSEPCGLICGCMTWLLLFYGMYATSIGVIIPWLGFSFYGLLHLFLFNGVSLVGLYSHIKVMTTDPGAVPPRARPLADDDAENEYATNREIAADPSVPFKKYCRRCKAYKPQRAHHCSICGRCIVKMDHHCPWVNNCVGVGNHKLFLLFVFWVFVSCMYSMLLVLVKYIYCIGGHHRCHTSPRLQFLVIFLVVESILFGLFTLCMLGDQMSAISSNQTAIDRLKGTRHSYQMEVNEVCGSGRAVQCHYTWFIPKAVTFPEGAIREKILGYRLQGGSGAGGGGSAGGAAGAEEDGEEGEEFNPLLDAGSGEGGGSAGGAGHGADVRGDVEMGTLHGSGTGGVGSGGVVSSPGGGYVLRKKMGTRGGAVDAREDENNSQNTNTSNESYGLEEPLSDWLDGSSGPSTGTTVGAGVVTSNGNGIAESAGLSGHGSPTAAGHNGGLNGSLSSSRLAEIAIGGDSPEESTTVRRVASGGGSGSNPTSPAVLLTSKDNAGSAGNQNATRRKRSGVPGAN